MTHAKILTAQGSHTLEEKLDEWLDEMCLMFSHIQSIQYTVTQAQVGHIYSVLIVYNH